ncbi:hypothetical protein GQ607_010810 [Colletotrichum asianum]|uniref:Uncharacterized protein n=1 Tax=Colletotrichum asianum TaxID=702518 RepID=A0A8H3ZNE3_9PEZI|nr:hypothetical protein GQ607_010810 [Colletotrichum asianum]
MEFRRNRGHLLSSAGSSSISNMLQTAHVHRRLLCVAPTSASLEPCGPQLRSLYRVGPGARDSSSNNTNNGFVYRSPPIFVRLLKRSPWGRIRF